MQNTQHHSTGESHLNSKQTRQQNINEIVAFFESGIKPVDSVGRLGIELEHTIVNNDISPVSYSEERGIAWLLEQLRSDYPQATTDQDGDLVGVARDGEAITIEPAAQIELSAGPFELLKDASQVFENFENLLESILAPQEKQALTIGYHPTAASRDLELIPKTRYKFMNQYLGMKDIHGPCMMRGSASTQVSIDYTSVDDCIRKLKLAFALVPLLSLISDNSPIFEGEARQHKLIRTAIWNHVDNDRCGLVPHIFEPDFTLDTYASYLLDTPAILVPCKTEQWCSTDLTFDSIYAEKLMTRAEIEHAASMFFNDVRLKTYIEIRPADAMPIPYVIAYAALIKGLFYSPGSLDALDMLFSNVTAERYKDAKESLMSYGYQAIVYGKPAYELCDEIIALAKSGLPCNEAPYLTPLASLVEQRLTLADLAE